MFTVYCASRVIKFYNLLDEFYKILSKILILNKNILSNNLALAIQGEIRKWRMFKFCNLIQQKMYCHESPLRILPLAMNILILTFLPLVKQSGSILS